MSIYKIILIAGFIVATYFQVNGKKSLPIFFPFMLVVVVFELFIEYYYYKIYGDNILILNFYSRLCIYYYLFVYWHYFRNRIWAGKLKFIVITYSLISFISFLIFLPKLEIDILNYNIGMFIVIPLIGVYLYEIIYLRDHENVFKNPYFYFSFGILIFYTSAFPILGFINILIVENPFYEGYSVLIDLGNIFLSLAYLGAALCSKKPILSTGLSSPPL